MAALDGDIAPMTMSSTPRGQDGDDADMEFNSTDDTSGGGGATVVRQNPELTRTNP